MAVETKNYSTKVTVGANLLGIGIKDILEVIGKSLEDGEIDLTTELPPILFSAIQNFQKVVDGYGAAKEEIKEEPFYAANGLVGPILEGAAFILQAKGKAVVVEKKVKKIAKSSKK